jgi:hypothetical protein
MGLSPFISARETFWDARLTGLIATVVIPGTDGLIQINRMPSGGDDLGHFGSGVVRGIPGPPGQN